MGVVFQGGEEKRRTVRCVCRQKSAPTQAGVGAGN